MAARKARGLTDERTVRGKLLKHMRLRRGWKADNLDFSILVRGSYVYTDAVEAGEDDYSQRGLARLMQAYGTTPKKFEAVVKELLRLNNQIFETTFGYLSGLPNDGAVPKTAIPKKRTT